MLRLGDACGVRLPDRVVAEADTVQDLIDAILTEDCGPKRIERDAVDYPAATAAVPAPSRTLPMLARTSRNKILQADHADRSDSSARTRRTKPRSRASLRRKRPARARLPSAICTSARPRSPPNCGAADSNPARPSRSCCRPAQNFSPPSREFSWPAAFPSPSTRHSAPTASPNTPRARPTSCATRKRGFWSPGAKPKIWRNF